MIPILGIATLTLFAGLALLWSRQVILRREAYIRTFDLPRGLFEQLRKRRPELSLKDCQLVARGLRQFFLAHLKSGREYVSMPSQVADDLWHEFILYTRNYQAFCGKAFGKFLHHTPAVALSSSGLNNAGLPRVWWYTCLEDNINPRKSSRLPLLFALDAKLGIPDGFRYAADCEAICNQQGADKSGFIVHCAGVFSSSTIDGSTDGFGDAAGGSWYGGDGGSDGSGAGGCVGGGDSGSCGGGGCGSN
jgi:hypothetical protein